MSPPTRPGMSPRTPRQRLRNRRWVLQLAVALPLAVILGVLVTMSVTGSGEVRDARVQELDPGQPSPPSVPTQPVPSPAPAPSPTPKPSPTPQPCTPVADTPLRVVSFNIRSARGPAGVDLDRVVAELRAMNPDVVLLQEVDRFRARSGGVDQPARIADALGMAYVFAPMIGRGGEYGIATLTRLPVKGHRVTRLPRLAGTEARGLIHLTVQVGETDVSIYNTHLEHSSVAARTAQVTTIKKTLGSDPLPAILGGDLNAVPGSNVHRRLTRHLVDTWHTAGQGPGHTVPAHSPRRRIDYVLADQHFTPNRSATHPTAVSDHRLLQADLTLTGIPCP